MCALSIDKNYVHHYNIFYAWNGGNGCKREEKKSSRQRLYIGIYSAYIIHTYYYIICMNS